MVQLLSYFNILTPPAIPDNKVKADLFLEVEEHGGLTGRFCWVLSGSPMVTATFKASEIMPGPRQEDYDLTFVTRPCDIKLAVNMTSTPWLDLADQVGKGHISVTRHGEDAAHEFLGKYLITTSKMQSKLTNINSKTTM
jgi:hypothetical protein